MPPLPPRRRKAQRSQSQGPANSERALRADARHGLPAPGLRNTQLVPYSPWQVILYRQPAGQAVLYNADSSNVEVARVPSLALVPAALQPPAPNHLVAARTDRAGSLDARSYACSVCPTCRQLLPAHAGSAWESHLEEGRDGGSPTRVFADREYFKQLARTLQPPRPPLTLSDSRDGSADLAQLGPSLGDETAGGPAPARAKPVVEGLSEDSFNQGYYERFFLEEKKLGKGLRGSVFSCQHILDNVYLGHYAVKKVAVGNNHQWLKRMLREVKLLESLRHPNVVEYKHSWLEAHQLTVFGPKVPCLFILMEYANGGNLQEYMESRLPATGDGNESSTSIKGRILRERRQSRLAPGVPAAGIQDAAAGGPRMLGVDQIWSFFSDICAGLAHLHQLRIIHRDLKHMNLLLQWKDPSHRDAVGGMPRIMLTDFGECEVLSHIEKRDRTGATGTMEFMAPELLAVDDAGRYLDSYSTKSDMWSLGMVLYYLCYACLPFASIDDIDVLRRDVLRLRQVNFAVVKRPDGAEELPPELHRIIQLLLNHDEAKRPDIGDVVQLVNEHSNLWHSRQFGQSRFEMHDSDLASSFAASPAGVTPRPSSPALGGGGGSGTRQMVPVTAAAPGPSQLSHETFADERTADHMPDTYRRQSTGNQLLLQCASAPPPAVGGHDAQQEQEGMRSTRHDSVVSGDVAYKDSGGAGSLNSSANASTDSGSDMVPTLGTKRRRAALDGSGNGYGVGSSRAGKQRRSVAGLEIGPAFCIKTAVLLAKAYALQRIGAALDLPSEQMMHMVCVSLTLSALDIHHQSLLVTALLLAANVLIVCGWLRLVV